MIVLKDGTRMFPRRGKAPEPDEGYEAKATDPYVHLLILEPCDNREFVDPECEGCGNSTTMHCRAMPNTQEWLNYEHKIIDRLVCKNCPIENQQQEPLLNVTVVESPHQKKETGSLIEVSKDQTS